MLHDWTILIATLGRRARSLAMLLDVLLPQVDAACGQVSVLALRNHGERPLGQVRQDLLEAATTDYVCFVDDDDMVPDYYVQQVIRGLRESPDYIGWRMQCYVNGMRMLPTYHSLRFGRWYEDGLGHYRDISHLNPVLRSKTTGTSFCAGWPEDRSWVDQMRGKLVTEHYIDECMYFYWSSAHDTVQDQVPEVVDPEKYNHYPLNIDSPNFSWHPAST